MPPDLSRWGIESGYRATSGEWRDAPLSTLEAIVAAMGVDGNEPPPAPILVVRPGAELRDLPGRRRLRLEDGSELFVSGQLPADVPFGYHWLEADDNELELVVSPGRCHLPADLRTWGWAVQLYALRSRRSWGMGDLADLGRLVAWSGEKGAGMVLVNPLHAPLPGFPQEPSPYFASSRGFRSPLYLCVEDVPGAAELPALAELAASGRALNADDRIDRDAIWRLKRAALEDLWRRFEARGGDRAFDRFCAEQGQPLAVYAAFCALTDVLGGPWRLWPAEVRRPDGDGVARFAADDPERVGFHQWLQWLVDAQLAAAGQDRRVGLMHDVAIGADVRGADAWMWQDYLALDMRVGAPPDDFNTLGQDWGFPPFDPWQLRSARYEPFRRIVQAGMRHAGGLRFDHVMGLFRLFWIPEGEGPTAGTYVRYPWSDLLDILALESHRARAYVVGEDLGTVEDFMRNELSARAVLSYRLLWFEPSPPESYPVEALAAITTHDLPTVAGLWTGADLRSQEELGLAPNVAATTAVRDRLKAWLQADDETPPDQVAEGAYGLLAEAPSAILAATLEDALAVEERPNMPGTIDQWPNWCLPLPLSLEAIETDPRVEAVAKKLNNRGASPTTQGGQGGRTKRRARTAR